VPEYQRLTLPSEAFDGATLKALCESSGELGCDEICSGKCQDCFVQEAFDRLSAYEDSGLSPEEVQGLAKAKTEGRLVVLPCKVGSDVYCIDNHGTKRNPKYEIYEYIIDSFTVGETLSFELFGDGIGDIYDIGKTVFLSREEAKKALEGGGE